MRATGGRSGRDRRRPGAGPENRCRAPAVSRGRTSASRRRRRPTRRSGRTRPRSPGRPGPRRSTSGQSRSGTNRVPAQASRPPSSSGRSLMCTAPVGGARDAAVQPVGRSPAAGASVPFGEPSGIAPVDDRRAAGARPTSAERDRSHADPGDPTQPGRTSGTYMPASSEPDPIRTSTSRRDPAPRVVEVALGGQRRESVLGAVRHPAARVRTARRPWCRGPVARAGRRAGCPRARSPTARTIARFIRARPRDRPSGALWMIARRKSPLGAVADHQVRDRVPAGGLAEHGDQSRGRHRTRRCSRAPSGRTRSGRAARGSPARARRHPGTRARRAGRSPSRR